MTHRPILSIAEIAANPSLKLPAENVAASVAMPADERGGAHIGILQIRKQRRKSSVNIVAIALKIILITIGNFVATPATSLTASGKGECMTNEQFNREMRYRTVMAVARTMMERGLISKGEFDAFDQQMIAKHNPMIGGLTRSGI